MITMLLYFIVTYFMASSSATNITAASSLLTSDMRGLYSPFGNVDVVNAQNFNEEIIQSDQFSVVEFYNVWCGHCIKFSPVWMNFADNISGWRDIVQVKAIDCANEKNTQICREYEIMGYPTVRLFCPHGNSADCMAGKTNEFGIPFSISYDVTSLRHTLLSLLMTAPLDKMNKNWPNFSPIPTPSTGRWPLDDQGLDQYFGPSLDTLILVSENNDSFTGMELILDMYKDYDKVRVLRSIPAVTAPWTAEWPLYPIPYIFAVYRRGDDYIEPICDLNNMRQVLYLHVSRFLLNRLHIDIRPFPNVETNTADIVRKILNEPSLLQNEAYEIHAKDLTSGLAYSMLREIPLKTVIQGENKIALERHLIALNKFHPLNITKFTGSMLAAVQEKAQITGIEFQLLVKETARQHFPFILKDISWVGCQGSTPLFRGYPCSVWTMFHTMTVNAFKHKSKLTSPTEVLEAMRGYIINFFGCDDCAKHFGEMSAHLFEEVKSPLDNVLWLWRAHNAVNNRTKGDMTEDPVYPKVQYPPVNKCKVCQFGNGSWNDMETAAYLIRLYSTINVDDEHSLANLDNNVVVGGPGHWVGSHSTPKKFLSFLTFAFIAVVLIVFSAKTYMQRAPAVAGQHARV